MLQQLKLLWRQILNGLSRTSVMQAGALHKHAPFVHHPQQQWPRAGGLPPLLQHTCCCPALDVSPDGKKEGLPNLIATDACERLTRDPLVRRQLLHCKDNGAAIGEMVWFPEDAIPKPLRLMSGSCQTQKARLQLLGQAQ